MSFNFLRGKNNVKNEAKVENTNTNTNNDTNNNNAIGDGGKLQNELNNANAEKKQAEAEAEAKAKAERKLPEKAEKKDPPFIQLLHESGNNQSYIAFLKNSDKQTGIQYAITRTSGISLADIENTKNEISQEIFQRKKRENNSTENELDVLMKAEDKLGSGAGSTENEYKIDENFLRNGRGSKEGKKIIFYSDDNDDKLKGKPFVTDVITDNDINIEDAIFTLQGNKLYYKINDTEKANIVESVQQYNLESKNDDLAKPTGGSKPAQNQLVKNHRKKTQNRRLKKRRYTNKRSNRRK